MDIIGLIPSFGNVLYTLGAFVLALSVIVTVHEYGHYIVGRMCGIHAEVFSIGFGPKLLSREDQWGTRWQIAALPFGGYVKFLGDAGVASDRASDDLAEMDAETLRHTMHGAPLWARAATVAAGPFFNFVLSIFVFAGVIMFEGEAVEPPTIAELQSLPTELGDLRPGDVIAAIDGRETPDFAAFYDVVSQVPVEPVLPYTVTRDGQLIEVPGPYPFPPLVAGVQPQSAAIEAGLKVGDVITAIDGAPLASFSSLQEIVTGSDGRDLVLTIWREGASQEITLAPKRVDMPQPDGGFETRWLIGMTGGLFFTPQTQTPGIGTALGYGADQTWMVVTQSLSGLYHMVSGAISSCNLRGPLGIAETSGAAASQGLSSFIWFIAVLSTAVGLLNLFPIPVLDGGHLVFHTYEALVGKPPSDRALNALMTLGLTFLLGMMLFAISNDLFCP
ncbi:putative membrane-associated zinc metalloprotease [Actibacterium atlanticum]|uniref:Zinc metalloprotease n=1 Tax=Actibacterium atlanticum TaxID=1461693 RepID=A0A058ZRS2_9RHOB|nr:RIP metalloprotease RseP [Actibacterium atlanticum]KCV83556.1 putative membrane-associated zinc metalloprotease [Actibacterium atlanticum]